MKILLHNIFIRHDEHIACNCDKNIREIFNKIAVKSVEVYKNIDIAINYKIPDFDEFQSIDSMVDVSLAPRIWADVYINWITDIDDIALRKILRETKLAEEGSYLYTLYEITTSIEHQLEIALLASNISSPGSVSYKGGYVKVEEDIYFTLSARNNYILEGAEFVSLGWPKTFTVSFENAWSWVNNILASSPDVGNSKASRALAAYSMIACGAEEWRSQLLLFWAMMGLEALYCEGSDGLKRQLYEKSQVILGPINENKKLIKKMYDTRSDFIHGSMNIPYVHTHNYDSGEADQFRQEIFQASRLAIQMLFATLQFMVLNERDDLNFTYHVI